MSNSRPLILCVDDEPEISELIALHLNRQGYDVITADNGEVMFTQLEKHKVNLILLDLMMPGEDGLFLCRKLRATSEIPIIMVTAMGDDIDRIIGLEVGADDYIAKPFNPRELIARIKAVLRRTQPAKPGHFTQNHGHYYIFGPWHFYPENAQLEHKSKGRIALTTGEYILLKALLERAPRILDRDYLLDLTSGREATPFDRAIDIQISRLRAKIEESPKTPKFIKTMRGLGYAFTDSYQKCES